ncbi:MAG: thioredoxin-dependent thiol peroxidase [Bacillota bacterium]|nr:thioredoxin-dependent thiol peroxidase [Bacillota bacterium]
MVEIGQKVADFRLKDEEGKEISLYNFKGKKVVIYFYPKDNTPGCTKEACSFRDVYDDIVDAGAVVMGISPDGQTPHKKFKEKFNLPFYLLCDEDHSIAESFGAWGEKKMYGKSYMGIIRSTFILDENMTVLKTYPKVLPEGHGEEILNALRG